MTIFLVLTTIASIVSSALIFTKVRLPKLERIFKKVSLFSLIGTIICLLLLAFNLRFKGAYTNSVIGLTFILSTILVFGLTKKNRTRVLSGLLTIPIFIFGVLSLIWEMPIVFFYLLTMLFQPPKAKFGIDNNHNVEVRVGGFMACDESLFITESTAVILDKITHVGNNSCVTGINKIETLHFDKNKQKFLIYHDGLTEFENPYEYEPNLKNVW